MLEGGQARRQKLARMWVSCIMPETGECVDAFTRNPDFQPCIDHLPYLGSGSMQAAFGVLEPA